MFIRNCTMAAVLAVALAGLSNRSASTEHCKWKTGSHDPRNNGGNQGSAFIARDGQAVQRDEGY
ncbi:hypothetical protein [Bradyrhizobium japonicum]|uniref:hypothetical protein n=1 Tax=Bradyrhizobium japonicum TaxID=375 RepID=UPI0035115D93